MNIDQPQTFPHQLISFQKIHDFVVLCFDSGRKRAQEGKNFISVPDEPTRQLPDHKTVANNFGFQQRRRQFMMSVSQVFDP